MNDKYRFNGDGTIDIKRKITKQVGPFQSFFEIGEAYFPCMDLDGDFFFRLALFTGTIGGHKFYTGNIIQGILYFITFGFFGIGYVIDLLLIILGGYSYKSFNVSDGTPRYERRYSRPLEDRKWALKALLVATASVAFLIKYMFWPLVIEISQLITEVLTNLG